LEKTSLPRRVISRLHSAENIVTLDDKKKRKCERKRKGRKDEDKELKL
jgi:hypothetical protein